ncbi:hypothetical protein P7K49_016940, partial [Saguinus oedipus]
LEPQPSVLCGLAFREARGPGQRIQMLPQLCLRRSASGSKTQQAQRERRPWCPPPPLPGDPDEGSSAS